ncbi:MAG: TfuA-like protein [Gammaproteobacteria bacterium]|jgi:hypothetical protein|nr:TfuA-like protein [Gammaproteobacteria bacterium]
MNIENIVFIDSTLSEAKAKEILPNAIYLPAIKAGDILKILFLKPKNILIIDGLFNQTASVKHKEILLALKCGINIFGASSMGALRAAELWPYGMIGHGLIYKSYKTHKITGDDEVAISFLNHKDKTVPLINIRFTLKEAVKQSLITFRDANKIINCLRKTPYYERTLETTEEILKPYNLAEWFRNNYIDQKKNDAIDLLKNFEQLSINPAIENLEIENIFLYKLYREVSSKPFEKIYSWLPEKTKKILTLEKQQNLLTTDFAKLLNLVYDASNFDSVSIETFLKEIKVIINQQPEDRPKKHLSAYYGQPESSQNIIKIASLYSYFISLISSQKVSIQQDAQKQCLNYIRRKFNLTTKEDVKTWLTQNNISSELQNFLEYITIYYMAIEEGNAHYLNIRVKSFDIYWLEQAIAILQ